MEQLNNTLTKDFSLVFNEINKFHAENPSFRDNYISLEDLHHNEIIKEFTDICREINDIGTNPIVYLTFS